MCLEIGHSVVWVDRRRRNLDRFVSLLSCIIIATVTLVLLLGLARCNLDFSRAPTIHL